jgi:hypothetical protein
MMDIQEYREAVFDSPIKEQLYDEAVEAEVPISEYVDDYIRDKLEKEAPFFMQEYAYGDAPNQKTEIRYGPYMAEVAMRDADGEVRFINRVEIDILLPTCENVDIVSCLVLTQALNYLLDLQDDEHDTARVCEETPTGD